MSNTVEDNSQFPSSRLNSSPVSSFPSSLSPVSSMPSSFAKIDPLSSLKMNTTSTPDPLTEDPGHVSGSDEETSTPLQTFNAQKKRKRPVFSTDFDSDEDGMNDE